MSLEESGEEGRGDAVGEECERGVGQRKAVEGLSCEVGGVLVLGGRCPPAGWQNHGGFHAWVRGHRTTRRPTIAI